MTSLSIQNQIRIRTRYSTFHYNSLIRSHARTRQFPEAFSFFARLRNSPTYEPDNFTFATLLLACSQNSDPNGLRALHSLLLSSGFGSDFIPVTSLLSSYAKLGLFDDAAKVFDEIPQPDLILYNSMLSGFGYAGFWQNGLTLFGRMRNFGQDPDGFSLVGLISCFKDPNSTQFGQGVHGFVLKSGLGSNSHVRSALVSMYSRLECLDSGYRVFREIIRPDLVTWSALITGFSHAGKWEEALGLFREMNSSLIRNPDPALIASVLSACASMAATRPGKEIHCRVMRVGLDPKIVCALIDFYAKCGIVESGLRVFKTMPDKNSVAYNVMISGLGSNGFGRGAIELFDKMLKDGFEPDKATFASVLGACSHSGLLEDGSRLFGRMTEEFCLEPEIEHYIYMVKLLCLVGKLEKAYELIRSMPKELLGTGSGVWGALLWGCGLHGRSDLGAIAGRMLFEMDPEKAAYRVMLANVYASEGKWGDVKCLREDMMGGGLKKVTGLSWIGK